MGKIKQIAIASWKHWREISFIYCIQLLIGLCVGLTFCAAMCSSLDNSMVLDQLAKGFDRTVIMDVLNFDGNVLDSTRKIALTLLGIYLLFSVWLQAGWLANIRTKTFSIKSLAANGRKFFFPFLGIALISILLLILYAAVVGIGFIKIVGDPLATFSSEKPFVLWIVTLIGTFIFWSILVWSWSVSTRFHFIDGNSFFASLKYGFKIVFEKFLILEAVGLLLIGIHVILMLVYYCIMGDRGAPSWVVVLMGILVQQIFAFARIAIRGFGYGLLEDLNSN